MALSGLFRRLAEGLPSGVKQTLFHAAPHVR